ncbi:MAG: hypothetical protein RLN76_12955 [Phycisphaeraceae bacterium]
MQKPTLNTSACAWTGVITLVLIGPCLMALTVPHGTTAQHGLLRLVCFLPADALHTVSEKTAASAHEARQDAARSDLRRVAKASSAASTNPLSDLEALLDLPPPAQIA